MNGFLTNINEQKLKSTPHRLALCGQFLFECSIKFPSELKLYVKFGFQPPTINGHGSLTLGPTLFLATSLFLPTEQNVFPG